jgi:formate-dependent phosphoribosylglycinamide formyltransferase (GAR transformylase)
VDFNDITLGEIEDIEAYAGLPISQIADLDSTSSKLRTAFVWIVKRRENPAFTIADAKNLPASELASIFETGSDPKAQ